MTIGDSAVAKANYRQAKRQKEIARKERQQVKQARRAGAKPEDELAAGDADAAVDQTLEAGAEGAAQDPVPSEAEQGGSTH